MLLSRVFAPARSALLHSAPSAAAATIIPSTRVLDALRASAIAPSTTSPSLSFVRHATHQAQGRANGAKDGPGKRLGAKKAGGEYVVPGNIIFRQRGTMWFPGENCKFGRDHCIFAMQAGYVRYYRDPLRHPDRQYIGVVFDKEDTLPYPVNAARKRRLNMLPVKKEEVAAETTAEITVEGATAAETTVNGLKMGKGYAFRKTNWEIGRAGDEMKEKVKKFIPGDRFTAWRKAAARKALNIERRKLRNAQKAAKPKRKPKAR